MWKQCFSKFHTRRPGVYCKYMASQDLHVKCGHYPIPPQRCFFLASACTCQMPIIHV